MLKNFFKYALAGLLLAFSFFAWISVDRAISVPGASVWISPMIWFTLYFISLSLSIVLIKRRYIVEFLALATLLISFLFVTSGYHIFAVALGSLILSLAISKIRKDLKLNIKVDLYKTLRTGSTQIVLALAIVLTSQYYFTIRDYKTERIIPKFKMEGAVNVLTSKMLSSVNPNFKDLSNEETTVDEFILKTQSDQVEKSGLNNLNLLPIEQIIDSQVGKKISNLQREALKQEYLKKITEEQSNIREQSQKLILDESRKKISEIVGVNLTGNEKMSDVFSQMINSKIASYVSPSINQKDDIPVLPMILAIIIFLTVLPIGSFLSPAWLLVSKLLFLVLVKVEIVRINKVPSEVEIII